LKTSLSGQSIALSLTTTKQQQRRNTQNKNTIPSFPTTNKLTPVKTQKYTQKPKPKTVHLQ